MRYSLSSKVHGMPWTPMQDSMGCAAGEAGFAVYRERLCRMRRLDCFAEQEAQQNSVAE